MSEVNTPRLMAAAKEFNMGTNTLIDFLISKGFSGDDLKPTTKLSEEMYSVLQSEFQQDKAVKQRADKIELHKGVGANEPKRKRDEPGLSTEEKEEKAPEDGYIQNEGPSSQVENILSSKLTGPKILGKITLPVDNDTNSNKGQNEDKYKRKRIPIEKKPDFIGKGESGILPRGNRPINDIRNTRSQSKDEGNYYIGRNLDVMITQVIQPALVYFELSAGYKGFLALQDISSSFPLSQELFNSYKSGMKLNCVISNLDSENKIVIFNQRHINSPLSEKISWERIDRGDEMEGIIMLELNTSFLIGTKNEIYGLLHKSFITDSNLSIKVKVNSKLDNCDLISFVPAYLEISPEENIVEGLSDKFSFIEEELQSFNKFKRSLLGTNASDTQCQIIQSGFVVDNKIFSKEFSTKHTLFIQFELNSFVYESTFRQQAIPYFTEGALSPEEDEKNVLEKLSKENYWFKINKRVNNKRDKRENFNEIIEFSLFNEQINFFGEVFISKDKKEYRFSVRNFSFGQSFAGATNAKKWYAKDGCFLFSNQLKVISPFDTLPFGSSQREILEFALLKTECFEIVNDLKLDAGEILRQEGRTLAINDKFLEYQIRLIDDQKENNVFVDNHEQIPGSGNMISIKMPISVGNSMELDDIEETIVNIRTKDKEDLKKVTDGKLSYYQDGCRLNFNAVRPVRLDLIKSGFYIDKKISTSQFDIQREIIQDFLEKKIKIDHIESLFVNPDKIKTPIIPKVIFHNPDLESAEKEQPDNNQVMAVRKAVGNQNVFLIQGPPGTGKTTVIAEIIEQLVERGEKILVSGQNHVAVDNVLSKIAKIPKLNLLRVGNPDKIDKDLVRYSIDNLVDDYKIDYNKFIANQLKLIQEFLNLKNANIDKGFFTKNYNDKVNGLVEEYGNLKEVYKQRHFILIDSLNQLNSQEIENTIVSFKSWIDSNNNDYDILLRPLIYNSVDVVFATCIGIKSDEVFKNSNFKFNTVIIDEAGKANIAETLVAVELGKKVILVGDQMQLPPYINSSLIDEKEPTSFPKSIYGSGFGQDEIVHALKTSFFEFIINRIEAGQFPRENKVMLNYQHRMHPNIGRFVSESFYDGLVLMGNKTHLNRLELPAPFNKEVVFFDTSNANDPFEQNDGYSAKNNTEAEVVSEIILPKLFEHNISQNNIAVIAPYKSQVANIQQYINTSTACNFKNIDVSTLDSFQGKEYDVIIFSFTRSANFKKPEYIDGKRKSTKVGFLDDARRLNVAFSRAKKKLIFVGNSVTLTDLRSHYDGLFDYTQLFRKLVELSKNDEIGKFVNIADYSDFKSPFISFCEKFKVNDFAYGIVDEIGVSKKTGNRFGTFILMEGFRLLAPYFHNDNILNKNFTRYSKGNQVVVRIVDIDQISKKVVVQIMEDVWYRKVITMNDKEPIMVEIFKILANGFLVKTPNGILGLLNVKYNRNLPIRQVGDKVKVILLNVDLFNKKIKFKIA